MGCISCGGGYMGAFDTSHCDGAGGTDIDGNQLNSDGSLYTGPCPIEGPIAPGPAAPGPAPQSSSMLIPLVAVAVLAYIFGRNR